MGKLISGNHLSIEITVDLEDSMLDSEDAIQAAIYETGTLATEEALKQFDTQKRNLLT